MGFLPQTQVLKDLSNDVLLVNEADLCGAPHKSVYVKRLIM
jgi:hypothetical protein